MKRFLRLLLVGVILVFGVGIVSGANFSDNLELHCTPVGDRGVIIDSTTIEFGTLDVSVTTISITGVTVTSTGTIGNIEYTIQGENLDTWQLEDQEAPTTENKVVLHALFQGTNEQPAEASFAGAGNRIFGTKNVGDTTNYEGAGAEMDNMALLTTRYLYFRLKTPPTTSVTVEQKFRVTIAAEAAN